MKHGVLTPANFTVESPPGHSVCLAVSHKPMPVDKEGIRHWAIQMRPGAYACRDAAGSADQEYLDTESSTEIILLITLMENVRISYNTNKIVKMNKMEQADMVMRKLLQAEKDYENVPSTRRALSR